MRIVVMRPDDTWSVEHIDGGLAALQKLVGGYVEAPEVGKSDITIWCNEEGKLEGLEANEAATRFWYNTFKPVATGPDFLAGTVVITGNARGDTTDVPPWVIHKLRENHDG